MKPVVELISVSVGAGKLKGKSGQEVISYCARVSNPNNQLNFDTAAGLLRYCIKQKHWSIFEQADFSVEVNTTRGIAAQILRHSSFKFQEFCLAGSTIITVSTPGGLIQKIPIEELYDYWNIPAFTFRFARSYDSNLNRFIDAPILSVYKSGEKPVYEYTIKGESYQRVIKCTREHRVFTKEQEFVPFSEAYDNNLTVAINDISLVQWGKIETEKYLGVQETFDIEMDHPTHNFVADGIVVHNSQRYADTNLLEIAVAPDLRRQDVKNRQNSIDDFGDYKKLEMQMKIQQHFDASQKLYDYLVEQGVAKECSRFVLPLATPTRLYMKGSVRSWIHYLQLRTDVATQKEHRDVANEIKCIFCQEFPDIAEALEWTTESDNEVLVAQ